MHSTLDAGNGILFMGSDTPAHMDYEPGKNFNMSLTGDNEPELRGYFEALSRGGTTTMPLEKAIWGDIFGMCIDKSGTSWLVNIAGKFLAEE
jgi:PhnB protein